MTSPIHRLQYRVAHIMARAELMKSQDLLRGMRKDRAREREKSGMHRPSKQVRASKTPLRGEEQVTGRSRRRRVLTPGTRPPTTAP